MILLTSQKDEIYDIIEAYDFSPSQFEITIEESLNPLTCKERATIIHYKNTDFGFRMEGSENVNNYFYSMLRPGETATFQYKTTHSWQDQKSFFGHWLVYLKRELTAPNKWERLQNEMKQISASYDNSIDKFSAQEYEELKQQMKRLKEGIKSIGLLPAQIAIINNKIDHLTELALTMNKFDWKGLFVGTIVNLTMTLALTPDIRTAFWGLIKIVLSPVIQLP